MSERDPRFDPMPGDVLIYGPQWQQEQAEVLSVGAGEVGVRYRIGIKSHAVLPCSLRKWREWMGGAEVVKRAEDAQEKRA